MAIEVLKDVKGILDKAGIIYWLDFGTLLGAVRDRRLIKWDPDIDLAAFNSANQIILDILPEFHKKRVNVYCKEENAGFKFQKNGIIVDFQTYQINNDLAEIMIINPVTWLSGTLSVMMESLSCRLYIRPPFSQVLHSVAHLFFYQGSDTRTGLLQDILTYFFSFFSFSQRQHLRNLLAALKKRSGVKFISVWSSKYHFERLESIDFYGIEFKIPSKVSAYLEHRYGQTWKIPIKDWDVYEWFASMRQK